ncbi:MAG TPA: hypothetical protein VL475_04595, partial [Planctomycetaceae bacterium]|nr:hypothetical protein [Planctomycetaceae bacterium]
AGDAAENDQQTAEKSKSRADERRLRDSDVPLEDQDLKHLRELLTGSAKTIATRFVAVKGTGEFAAWLPASATLAIPERDLSIIQPGGPEPTGAITFDDGGTERILAAAYRIGEGEVVVVAAAVAENRQIAQADNSVLMVRLLSSAGRPVVFDEFYHGLTLRGNPLWLFTRPGYAAATICLLILIGLWVWREAVFLGPPLEAAAKSRRTLGEYVEAMARFLNRGASSRPFLLREVREGALHAIRQELRLPPGREHVDELAAVLARRSPGRARDLIEAVADIDSALTAKHKCREQDAVRLMQRISHCL